MIPKLKILSMSQKFQVDQFVTKFGGQPVWLDAPQWPVSQGWDGRPMMFVGQIVLDKNIFGNETKKVAYIFISHKENPDDNFFDPDIIYPDGGENAVIIQPGIAPEVKTIPQSTGPTLFDFGGHPYEGVPTLNSGTDPEFINSSKFLLLPENEQKKYYNSVDGNKIGGVPAFFQEDEWPEGDWQLLMQLNTKLPFYLNLGASPTLFAFISKDLNKGCLLIQDM